MVTLYNVVSEDGFIARKDGSEDFIPNESWERFLKKCADYDALVVGRKTYEAIQSYEADLVAPFEALPIKKYVLSRDEGLPVGLGYTPLHSIDEVAALQGRVLVSSGPGVNKQLIERKLVQEKIVETVPVTIGEGIAPY